jgi:UPF0042 nucleotide-binding protein
LTAIEFFSFGYKYGPEYGDLVCNIRFLPNPYYVDELRPMSGLDAPCADYVMGSPAAQDTFRHLKELVLMMASGFSEDTEKYPTLKVCIGCTGGKHRSVAFVEALAKAVREKGFPANVRHREMEAGRY